MRALERTASLWDPIQTAFGWVFSAAKILKNEAELSGQQTRLRLRGLMGAMQRWQIKTGELKATIDHFLKVTRSYWSGLFHCYDVPDLPRTNNDLEHLFGSQRYHERRVTGRKLASSSLVLRGSVRIVSAMATRLRSFSADDLKPKSIVEWRTLRAELTQHRYQRTLQRRFRQNPDIYLALLETKLNQLILLP